MGPFIHCWTTRSFIHLYISHSFIHSPIAAQPKLVEDERRGDFAGALFVVGNDASHEVGVRVPQRRHEARELLFVELTHRAEHSLARARPELALVRRPRAHA